jgi:hypothetical protein
MADARHAHRGTAPAPSLLVFELGDGGVAPHKDAISMA